MGGASSTVAKIVIIRIRISPKLVAKVDIMVDMLENMVVRWRSYPCSDLGLFVASYESSLAFTGKKAIPSDN